MAGYGIGALTQGASRSRGSSRKETPSVRKMARKGTRGDDTIAHLSSGEMVIPKQMQSAGLMGMLKTQAAKSGINPDELEVGNNKAQTNPYTGAQMFGHEEGGGRTSEGGWGGGGSDSGGGDSWADTLSDWGLSESDLGMDSGSSGGDQDAFSEDNWADTLSDWGLTESDLGFDSGRGDSDNVAALASAADAKAEQERLDRVAIDQALVDITGGDPDEFTSLEEMLDADTDVPAFEEFSVESLPSRTVPEDEALALTATDVPETEEEKAAKAALEDEDFFSWLGDNIGTIATAPIESLISLMTAGAIDPEFTGQDIFAQLGDPQAQGARVSIPGVPFGPYAEVTGEGLNAGIFGETLYDKTPGRGAAISDLADIYGFGDEASGEDILSSPITDATQAAWDAMENRRDDGPSEQRQLRAPAPQADDSAAAARLAEIEARVAPELAAGPGAIDYLNYGAGPEVLQVPWQVQYNKELERYEGKGRGDSTSYGLFPLNLG